MVFYSYVYSLYLLVYHSFIEAYLCLIAVVWVGVFGKGLRCLGGLSNFVVSIMCSTLSSFVVFSILAYIALFVGSSYSAS
jgi:hypothetical protein